MTKEDCKDEIVLFFFFLLWTIIMFVFNFLATKHVGS